MVDRYRHRMTGIYGKLEITPAGNRVVRADEGWTSDLSDWVRERSWRPVQRSQLAIAAFAADAAIKVLFTHQKPEQWASLSEDDKSAFIKFGPSGLRKGRDHMRMRQDIYDFIMQQLDSANEDPDDNQQNG